MIITDRVPQGSSKFSELVFGQRPELRPGQGRRCDRGSRKERVAEPAQPHAFGATSPRSAATPRTQSRRVAAVRVSQRVGSSSAAAQLNGPSRWSLADRNSERERSRVPRGDTRRGTEHQVSRWGGCARQSERGCCSESGSQRLSLRPESCIEMSTNRASPIHSARPSQLASSVVTPSSAVKRGGNCTRRNVAVRVSASVSSAITLGRTLTASMDVVER